MTIHYTSGGRSFSISYKELKANQEELALTTDEDFAKRLTEVLHISCVIAWFKELPVDITLSDTGLIHELAHLLHLGSDDLRVLASSETFRNVREMFKTHLKLD